jgi:hypothetical protein
MHYIKFQVYVLELQCTFNVFQQKIVNMSQC